VTQNGATQIGFGAVIGEYMPQYKRDNLRDATADLIKKLQNENAQMNVAGGPEPTTVVALQALLTKMRGNSVFGGGETDTLVTVMRQQRLWYIVFIAPDKEPAARRETHSGRCWNRSRSGSDGLRRIRRTHDEKNSLLQSPLCRSFKSGKEAAEYFETHSVGDVWDQLAETRQTKPSTALANAIRQRHSRVKSPISRFAWLPNRLQRTARDYPSIKDPRPNRPRHLNPAFRFSSISSSPSPVSTSRTTYPIRTSVFRCSAAILI